MGFTLWVPTYLLLLVTLRALVNSDHVEGENEVFFCRNPKGKLEAPSWTYPPNFTVSIEAVYSNSTNTTRLSDLQQSIAKDVSSVIRYEDGIRYQYIFNDTTKKFSFVNDSVCIAEIDTTKSLGEYDPILLPRNKTQGWLETAKTILDVWTWAISKDPGTNIYKDDTGPSHEHGIPIDHYYVCKNFPGNYVIEIEICVTSAAVKMPFPDMKGPFPVRMDFKRYYNGTSAGNDTKVEEAVGYRLSNYHPVTMKEEVFLPPPGVPCKGAKSDVPMPVFPENLGVAIDFVDANKQVTDTTTLDVNMDQHLVALSYTSNDSTIPLTEHAPLPSGTYRIVHDFHYGLQYIIDKDDDICLNVSDIPNDAADAELKETTKGRQMTMKSAGDLLGVHLDNDTVYYVGERMWGVIPADVWLAYKEDSQSLQNKTRNVTTVHEIYFSKPGWTFRVLESHEEIKKPTLLAVKKYEWVDPGTGEPKPLPAITTNVFFNFVEYPKDSISWTYYDVAPCLNFSRNDSYLVAFANDSLANVDKRGRANVETAMKVEIANAAKISPLRVTNFYFEAVNDTFWVFFFIADKPIANGSKTEWYNESISVHDARANLNKTLMAGYLPVKVPLEKDYYVVALNKGSLAAVPPLFSAPVVENIVKPGSGYSGSSMAALGICMLLIGGVLGLVLAFFMWKRNRAGSGAPVYYTNKSSA